MNSNVRSFLDKKPRLAGNGHRNKYANFNFSSLIKIKINKANNNLSKIRS